MFEIIEVRLEHLRYPNLSDAITDIYNRIDDAIEFAEQQVPSVMLDALQAVSDEMQRKHGNPWSGQEILCSEDQEKVFNL